MPAGIYNFNCEQGSTFERVIEVTNNDDTIKNLDGVTGRMQVRTTIDAASAMVEFTTANGKMIINIKDKNDFYKFFQINKKYRKNLKK